MNAVCFDSESYNHQSNLYQFVSTKHESTSNIRLPSKRGFKIASLNVNSLSAHIDEVRILLDDNFLDVLAIQETKLNNSHRDSEFYIPRFDLVRRDRISDGDGGVCFYIKSSINFYSEMCCQWFPFRMLHPQVWYSPGNNIGASTVFAIYQ